MGQYLGAALHCLVLDIRLALRDWYRRTRLVSGFSLHGLASDDLATGGRSELFIAEFITSIVVARRRSIDIDFTWVLGASCVALLEILVVNRLAGKRRHWLSVHLLHYDLPALLILLLHLLELERVTRARTLQNSPTLSAQTS